MGEMQHLHAYVQIIELALTLSDTNVESNRSSLGWRKSFCSAVSSRLVGVGDDIQDLGCSPFLRQNEKIPVALSPGPPSSPLHTTIQGLSHKHDK